MHHTVIVHMTKGRGQEHVRAYFFFFPPIPRATLKINVILSVTVRKFSSSRSFGKFLLVVDLCVKDCLPWRLIQAVSKLFNWYTAIPFSIGSFSFFWEVISSFLTSWLHECWYFKIVASHHQQSSGSYFWTLCFCSLVPIAISTLTTWTIVVLS